VITGDILASLDTTGTLTQKYQARFVVDEQTSKMLSEDTDNLTALLQQDEYSTHFENGASDPPIAGILLPMKVIFERLTSLVGHIFTDQGHDQERNRGMELHRMICRVLGYDTCSDDGQFPDLRHQLLEVKLQTSSTIDLGLVPPNSKDPLDIPPIEGRPIRPCDVRYALFSAHIDDQQVILSHFYLTNGETFFSRFPQFQGKVVNKKLQIRLPSDFFNS